MKEDQIKKSNFIYFAVLSTTLANFAIASCYTWASPMVIKFGNSNPADNPIGTVTTTLETSWIVSAFGVGLICGPPTAIFFSKYLLKKTILLLFAGPLVIAHIICIFASTVSQFIVARFLMGLGCGSMLSVLGNYIAELSEDSNRGVLGSFTGVLCNLGSLFIYAIGPFIQVNVFSIINLIPLILFYFLFGFYVPHSPYDLIKIKKYQDAKISLITLRRHSKVEKEIAMITKATEMSTNTHFKITDLFKDKSLFKSLLICMGLMTSQQLSGVLAVGGYTQTIFEQAGSEIPSAVSAIVIGLVSSISSIISCNLIDRMGRKFLLIISCTSDCLSLIFLGTYFYLLTSGKDVSMISWVPIVSLIMFTVGFNFGLIVLPWVVMGEIFPSDAKPVATTIVCLNNFTLSFLVQLCFPYMAEYLGMAWSFWIFSGLLAIFSTFCLIYLPETKGKSFEEILIMLKV